MQVYLYKKIDSFTVFLVKKCISDCDTIYYPAYCKIKYIVDLYATSLLIPKANVKDSLL